MLVHDFGPQGVNKKCSALIIESNHLQYFSSKMQIITFCLEIVDVLTKKKKKKAKDRMNAQIPA